MNDQVIAMRLCDHERCDKDFVPQRDDQRFCSSKCRAAAAREKALAGPCGVITSGPRKNKRGVSITVQFTGDDAVRVLRLNPKDSVHVYPAEHEPATDN